jgi:hypothetical protein
MAMKSALGAAVGTPMVLAALAATSVAGSAFAGAGTSVTVIDLGTLLPGASSFVATGINEAGEVVGAGQVTLTGGMKPIIWSADGATIIDDGTTTGRIPSGISGDGVVAGTQPGLATGWVFADGQFPCVPEPFWCTIPGFFYQAYSQVLAVSESGLLTGGFSVTNGQQLTSAIEAFLGSVNDAGEVDYISLGKLDGQSTVGRGVNDFGHVVGWTVPFSNSKAFLNIDEVFTVLPGLGGTYNRADAVNNTGLAVGFASNPGVQNPFLDGQAVVWDISDPDTVSTTAIGQVAGSYRTFLFDINDDGIAVGTADITAGNVIDSARAIVWTAETGAVDLNTWLPDDSGWTLVSANAINGAGVIVGVGYLEGVPGTRPFMLIPPASDDLENDRVEDKPADQSRELAWPDTMPHTLPSPMPRPDR